MVAERAVQVPAWPPPTTTTSKVPPSAIFASSTGSGGVRQSAAAWLCQRCSGFALPSAASASATADFGLHPASAPAAARPVTAAPVRKVRRERPRFALFCPFVPFSLCFMVVILSFPILALLCAARRCQGSSCIMPGNVGSRVIPQR